MTRSRVCDIHFKTIDPRIEVGRQEIDQMIEASPDLLAVHPLQADAADEEIFFSEKLKSINQITKVITAYPLETQNLKSKRNLIF